MAICGNSSTEYGDIASLAIDVNGQRTDGRPSHVMPPPTNVGRNTY